MSIGLVFSLSGRGQTKDFINTLEKVFFFFKSFFRKHISITAYGVRLNDLALYFTVGTKLMEYRRKRPGMLLSPKKLVFPFLLLS